MLKYISGLILKIIGWKYVGDFPYERKRFIFLLAPHTSNLDFFLGRLFFFQLNVPVKFLIKKEAFFWPFGGLLKRWGGIPVDRKKNNRMVDYVAGLFEKHDTFYLVVTPEGTRKLQKQWKRGFYYLSLRAKVPLALSYIDYAKKEVDIMEMFTPTGDYKKDLEYIQSRYMDKVARHPEQFNLSVTSRSEGDEL